MAGTISSVVSLSWARVALVKANDFASDVPTGRETFP